MRGINRADVTGRKEEGGKVEVRIEELTCIHVHILFTKQVNLFSLLLLGLYQLAHYATANLPWTHGEKYKY
jgi:hypothetical protein